MAYFSPENVATLNEGLEQIHGQSLNLRECYILRKYKSELAREYVTYGFCRRLIILVRAIDLVFEGLPPEREDVPGLDEVMDATIAIQSFVFNTFGCLDNLAWILRFEKDIKNEDGTELKYQQVGLGKKHTRMHSSFSNEFRAYLSSRQNWLDHLKEFRDALAHRIPLYIPPSIITPEAMNEYDELEHASDEAVRRGISTSMIGSKQDRGS
jgi:hypothetical protein